MTIQSPAPAQSKAGDIEVEPQRSERAASTPEFSDVGYIGAAASWAPHGKAPEADEDPVPKVQRTAEGHSGVVWSPGLVRITGSTFGDIQTRQRPSIGPDCWRSVAGGLSSMHKTPELPS